MDNVDYDGRIARLNGQRHSALKSGDAVLYAHSCNALGMVPEDDALYTRGMDLIEINRRRFASYVEQRVSDSKRIEKKTRFRRPDSERLGSEGWFD